MKRFFYASLAILALTISFHLGASSVGASGSVNTVAAVVFDGVNGYAFTDTGDLYVGRLGNPADYQLRGNIFNQTTKTEDASWSDVKEMFR